MKFRFNSPKFKLVRRFLRNEMTPAENLLWAKIKNKQLLEYKFRRQYSVGPFVVDFYCPELKLAIELDGKQHAENSQKTYDEARTNYLNDHNIKVIRYWNQDIMSNINSVCEDILNKIREVPPLSIRTSPPKLGGDREGVLK